MPLPATRFWNGYDRYLFYVLLKGAWFRALQHELRGAWKPIKTTKKETLWKLDPEYEQIRLFLGLFRNAMSVIGDVDWRTRKNLNNILSKRSAYSRDVLGISDISDLDEHVCELVILTFRFDSKYYPRFIKRVSRVKTKPVSTTEGPDLFDLATKIADGLQQTLYELYHEIDARDATAAIQAFPGFEDLDTWLLNEKRITEKDSSRFIAANRVMVLSRFEEGQRRFVSWALAYLEYSDVLDATLGPGASDKLKQDHGLLTSNNLYRLDHPWHQRLKYIGLASKDDLELGPLREKLAGRLLKCFGSREMGFGQERTVNFYYDQIEIGLRGIYYPWWTSAQRLERPRKDFPLAELGGITVDPDLDADDELEIEHGKNGYDEDDYRWSDDEGLPELTGLPDQMDDEDLVTLEQMEQELFTPFSPDLDYETTDEQGYSLAWIEGDSDEDVFRDISEGGEERIILGEVVPGKNWKEAALEKIGVPAFLYLMTKEIGNDKEKTQYYLDELHSQFGIPRLKPKDLEPRELARQFWETLGDRRFGVDPMASFMVYVMNYVGPIIRGIRIAYKLED